MEVEEEITTIKVIIMVTLGMTILVKEKIDIGLKGTCFKCGEEGHRST